MPLMPPSFLEQWVKDNGGWDAVLERAGRDGSSLYDISWVQDLIHSEPWPHLVHYQKHRVIYVPPEELLMWRPDGPSDCTWIVPGTGQ